MCLGLEGRECLFEQVPVDGRVGDVGLMQVSQLLAGWWGLQQNSGVPPEGGGSSFHVLPGL